MHSHAEKIFSNYNWTTSIEAQLKVNVYGKMKSFSQNHPITIRVLSPIIGITAGFVTIARQIIQIAESALLLLGSIFAALGQVKGVNPLLRLGFFVLVTPIDILKLPFTVIYAALETVLVTLTILMFPQNRISLLQFTVERHLIGPLDQKCYSEHSKCYPKFFNPENDNTRLLKQILPIMLKEILPKT
jgi:hypothetical protein